jgi:hypothetical protein
MSAQRLLVPAFVAAVFVLSAIPAFGGDSGALDAHVTVAAPCLTVALMTTGGTQLDFGVLPFSPSTTTWSSSTAPNHQVENCSPGAEKIYVRGTNAGSTTSRASWALSTNATLPGVGQNVYALRVTSDQFGNFTQLATSNRLLFGSVPANTVYNRLLPRIYMPLVGSAGAGERMDFQIVYTAAF